MNNFGLFSLLFGLALSAYVKSFWNSKEYDAGKLGVYPYQEYGSFHLTSPRLNILTWDPICEYGYTLLTPRGGAVPEAGPMIIDGKGNLIWTDDRWGEAANLRIQTFQGEEYLTFWAGVVEGTYGHGKFYMLDSSYETRYTVQAAGDLDGDMHEFLITPQGTALITIYQTISFSFKDMDTPFNEGYIVDSLFQEVDIETGELIFEWRASDHFPPSDSMDPIEGYGSSADKAYDFFHINSVSKGVAGNYWISSRFFNAVFCVSHLDGSVLHTLGGPNNDFHDLSNGAATNFTGQHHMTYHFNEPSSAFAADKNNEYVTVFDNGENRFEPENAPQSRALVIHLDMEDRSNPKATLFRSYLNPLPIYSLSQGSVQVLPAISSFENVPSVQSASTDTTPDLQTADETVFVGWGQSGAYTTFDAVTGTVLCDVHYASYSSFDWGFAKSYRVFKHMNRWIGRPTTRPAIGMSKLQDDPADVQLYASWNGATEVQGWLLQGSSAFQGATSDAEEAGWEDVMKLPKAGFEIKFDMSTLSMRDKNSARSQERNLVHSKTKRQGIPRADGSTYAYYRVLAVSNWPLSSDPKTNRSPDKSDVLGVTATLFVENSTYILPVADSKNSSVIQVLADNQNVEHKYAILPAVVPPHKHELARHQALDHMSKNSNPSVVVVVFVSVFVITGIILRWRKWLKQRIKRLYQRPSSAHPDKDANNAIPLLATSWAVQNDSDEDDASDDDDAFTEDPYVSKSRS